jgi:hypothetical protein
MTLLEGPDNPWRAPPAPRAALDLRSLLGLAAAATFDVPLKDLRGASRGAAHVAFARQSAMYLAHVALGLSYSAVGKLFGRDRTTAAHACQMVEDRRDDPHIDLCLDLLEALCTGAVHGAAPWVRR